MLGLICRKNATHWGTVFTCGRENKTNKCMPHLGAKVTEWFVHLLQSLEVIGWSLGYGSGSCARSVLVSDFFVNQLIDLSTFNRKQISRPDSSCYWSSVMVEHNVMIIQEKSISQSTFLCLVFVVGALPHKLHMVLTGNRHQTQRCHALPPCLVQNEKGTDVHAKSCRWYKQGFGFGSLKCVRWSSGEQPINIWFSFPGATCF